MSIKDIRLFGDPVLRTTALEVTDFDKELRVLVKDLQDTMLQAPGSGLAAPQIGVGLRVFTYHVDEVVGHLVNPVLELSEEEQCGPEGCLSIPGLAFDTRRALTVVARGQNMWGEPVLLEGSDVLARCVPARDRPPRRHPLRRPSRCRGAQGGDAGDPGGGVVRGGRSSRAPQPPLHLRTGDVT